MMKYKGFSLVEIMVVVGIIALLTAIAVPNALRARLNANESAAKSTLKTIAIACESYRASQAVPAYPANSAALTGATPAYIDASVFVAGGKQGYVFVYTYVGASNFVCSAHPISANITGSNRFAVNESGVLRSDGGASAVTTEANYAGMKIIDY